MLGQLLVRPLRALDGSVACSAEAVGTKHTRQKHVAKRRDKNFLIMDFSNFYAGRVLISRLDQSLEGLIVLVEKAMLEIGYSSSWRS